jgi:SNF2 family DNA or RNA helicase
MNWVREFERWAPKLRVVPFYGEKDARGVIKEFELFHGSTQPGNLEIKFHVLVTTYEAITNSKGTGAIFKHPPRWEVLTLELSRFDYADAKNAQVLVVDEGQRRLLFIDFLIALPLTPNHS